MDPVALCDGGPRLDTTPSTLACAWPLRQPSRPVPVAWSRRIEALRDAVAALAPALDLEDGHEIWQASSGREVA